MAVLRAVTMDCASPDALAEFYVNFAGFELSTASEDFAGVVTDTGAWIGFQRVEQYRRPSWPTQDVPQQFHLDFVVEDLEAAEDAAIRLGATKPDDQPGGDRWRVLLDPEGHPFCLAPA